MSLRDRILPDTNIYAAIHALPNILREKKLDLWRSGGQIAIEIIEQAKYRPAVARNHKLRGDISSLQDGLRRMGRNPSIRARKSYFTISKEV